MIDRIDALLFDLGGVLVEIDFERVCARWAEAASRPVAHVKARFSHGEAYARHERGELGIAAYCDRLRHELQIELDDEQLVEGWQRVFVKEIEPTVLVRRPEDVRMAVQPWLAVAGDRTGT